MQKHGSKHFAQRPLPNSLSPPPDPGVGIKGQNSFLSKHGHVAYQIKENH